MHHFLLVVPAQFLRPVLAELAELLADNAMLVLCAKGIERGKLNFMSQLAADYVDESRIAVLSGPSFAADVARDLPTAVTLAAHDMAIAETLAARLGTAHFRPYAANDVIGAEIGGAIKNVLAIACGIIGRGLGESARAAITARGCRNDAAWRSAGRAARLAGRSVGSRRPNPDLCQPDLAQFFTRRGIGQRPRHG